MAAYEANVLRGELEAASNALRLARTTMGIYMTAAEKAHYEALPGYAVGDNRSSSQVLTDMEERREYLLRIGRKHGVGATPEEEIGDSSTLEIPIPDEAA